MPRGDQTGPRGMGPMTGRAAGFCAGRGVPGYANPGPGQGLRAFGGGAYGGGRGCRHRYYATGLPGWARAGYWPWRATPVTGGQATEQEAAALRPEAEYLRATLEGVEQRLKDLEAPGGKRACENQAGVPPRGS